MTGRPKEPRDDSRQRGSGDVITVKLMGSWCRSEDLCLEWDRMSQGGFRWNDVEVTWEDRDIDFYVIVNFPRPGEHYVPERTIVLQMEPWCGMDYQTWGVKTWGEWSDPDPSKFLRVINHDRTVNTAFWQLASTYRDLKREPSRKTRVLSTICSAKYFDPGHRKRVNFLRFLETRNDDVVRVDVWGHDNALGLRSWVGPHPEGLKDAALMPYKYFFAAENNSERNFITEKLWEPILTETLCFYWGCPNATDWIDARAFIPLNLDDFEEAFWTMKSAITANEWERRLDIIRREKQKILEHYQFFPLLERILQRELRVSAGMTNTDILYRKYFGDTLDADVKAVAFIHSFCRSPSIEILTELLHWLEVSGLLAALDRVYVFNVGLEIPDPDMVHRHAGKIRIVNYSKKFLPSERVTLELLQVFSSFHDDARILYLHTKGASHDHPNQNVEDWRQMLLHFLVTQYNECLDALEQSDVVGCNQLNTPRPHFSGNFWWANASYLQTLPRPPREDRHESEFWVLGSPNVRARSQHDSGINHYESAYPWSSYAPRRSPPATPTAICLVMILKDEAHIVLEGLGSVLPFIRDYVIVDTGSTDDTKSLVRTFFASNGVPGHALDRPWRDFGTNRSEALELARELSSSAYLWMFDADDLVSGRPEIGQLAADAYYLRFGPDNEYRRLQIFRRTLPWRYRGVLHEYPVCESSPAHLDEIGGGYWILSRRLGSRNRDPEKYQKDARVLETALATEPDNSRYVFYLAQSWFDAGRPERALPVYRRRVELGGWEEEIFYARYRVALCLHALGEPYQDVVGAFEECCRAHPGRAEPLVRAAALARQAGHYRQAYDYASTAVGIKKPGNDALFLESADYDYRALDEQSIAAFYIGRQAESFSLCEALLNQSNLPQPERARIERNRDFSIPHVEDAFRHYPARLIEQLARRSPREAKKVTLSVTTCKRLGLFMETICSFLNACADIDRVDRFVCIDDGSCDADLVEMKRLFPFFEFIAKPKSDKGHAQSLNRLLDMVDTPYLLHLEDDWRFFSMREYIRPAIELLKEDTSLGQVLFNRNYAETIGDREIAGGIRGYSERGGICYLVHEYYSPDSPEFTEFHNLKLGPSNAYWPHFSLRPSLLDVASLRRLGRFDEEADHFELDYARRYTKSGLRSAFFDTICAVHTGRLTSERGAKDRPNAYDLNQQVQFGSSNTDTEMRADPVRDTCRVRLFGESRMSNELCTAFARQTKEPNRWDELEITSESDADYSAMIGSPDALKERFPSQRTVVFFTRPPRASPPGGNGTPPDPFSFLQLRNPKWYPGYIGWHLDMTWNELKAEPVGARNRVLSAIVPGDSDGEGQKLRLDFLQHLQSAGVPVDVYGGESVRDLRGFQGPLPYRDSRDGLLPYRYTIAVESHADANHFTEKILDAILAECLPFYWGCPNLEDYLDPQCFIRLPLEDPEGSRRILEQAVAEEAWSRRIDAIRKEKSRILDELHLFPVLARVIRGHRLLMRMGIRVINLDRRTDRQATFNQRMIEAAGEPFASRVERFSAIDGRQLTLTPEISRTFRENDFNFRRGIVGCALSHMALWKELENSQLPALLIFEDDVLPCEDFSGQLINLCGELEERHPQFDILFLGFSAWGPAPEFDFERASRAARTVPFDGRRYLGGAFAYIVSRRGARKLLAMAQSDGVKNGIDRYIQTNAEKLQILACKPCLVTSQMVSPGSGLDSDIQNDFNSLGE